MQVVRLAKAHEAKQERLLNMLAGELDRTIAAFKGHKDAPYFVSYRVADVRSVSIGASRGALDYSHDTRRRRLSVDVHVGSYEFDDRHPRRRDGRLRNYVFSVNADLPVEDSQPAIAAVLWRHTARAHQQAVTRLDRLRRRKPKDAAPATIRQDLTREPAAKSIEPLKSLEIDKRAWEQKLRRLSERFRRYPRANRSGVWLSATRTNTFFASSEGSRLQSSRTLFRLSFNLTVTTDDGMELSRHESIDVERLSDLPSEAELAAMIDRVMADVRAFESAPVADAFSGPVIFDAAAAGRFLHELLGHALEGDVRRPQRADDQLSVGDEIAPGWLDLYDDPLVSSVNGAKLLGRYHRDDEGVPARRVSLVEAGVVRALLLSRSPPGPFTASNGHGRRDGQSLVMPRQGNLFVHPKRVVTRQQLKAQLLAEVKKQGKPYGLRIAQVATGSSEQRGYRASSRVAPVMVFRVYPDGREELVRGLALDEATLPALQTLKAAANDPAVANHQCGGPGGRVWVSTVSPSLLFGRVEVSRSVETESPPVLPPPPTGETVP